ncbi:MAG TPA: cytochrome P450 [Tepidisphaeraceae bacterium]|nr:cytochrome P450 [Tepidisphaeraceae bacterium]
MPTATSQLPPGPTTPAVWQLLQYSHSPLRFLERCAARFGDPFTVRWAGYGTFVMLAEPEAVRDVFRGDPHVLHSGESNEFLSPTIGKTSVLVLDDEPHLSQRRLLLPPLKGERMRAFFDVMQSATERELRGWPLGTPIRMVEPMRRITLQVISQAVMGFPRDFDSGAFEQNVSRMLNFGRTRYSLIWLKLTPTRLLAGSKWVPYFRQMRKMDDAIFDQIATLRRGTPGERPPSVLADLVAAAHDDGSPLGDREIRDALVTLLIAGHDTTALGLAWALEQIVPRADVMARITDELRRVSGGKPPAADQLDELVYLDAAIRESLRLRTQLPFVTRLTKQPFVAGGREYPAGVVLCPCSHLVHRRPDLYPDPQAFRPERFIERRFAGHEWFPFGGGGRACLGMAFALYEMKVVLATLFARVDLARPAGSRSTAVRQGIALGPDDGAMTRVTGRR